MSYLIYSGPSRINGAPIVAFWQAAQTDNRKTGQMAQIWILSASVPPAEGVKQRNTDSVHVESICGDCPLIGSSCYVTTHYGPQAIFRSWKRGNTPAVNRVGLINLARGQLVRFGAYGDPAALPVQILSDVARYARKTVGYTHQWRKFPDVAPYCMASVETSAQADEARSLGFRTFRTRIASEPIRADEISCPASEEQGKRLQCADCMACRGAGNGRSIVIIAHGAGAQIASYARLRQAMETT